MIPLTLIVAATRTNGIGQGALLPWRLSLEMAYFARITKNAPPGQVNSVIMGRKTWESIPKKRRPLVDRLNIILTSDIEYDIGVPSSQSPAFIESSLESALTRITQNPSESTKIYRNFIIGGASIYNDALALQPSSPSSLVVDRILLTRILLPEFECDVFFPNFTERGEWKQVSHEDLEAWVGFEVARGVQDENGVQYEFQMWVKEG